MRGRPSACVQSSEKQVIQQYVYRYHACTAKTNGKFVRSEYSTVSPPSPRRALLMLYSGTSEERDQPNLGVAAAKRTDIIIQRAQLFRKLCSETVPFLLETSFCLEFSNFSTFSYRLV